MSAEIQIGALVEIGKPDDMYFNPEFEGLRGTVTGVTEGMLIVETDIGTDGFWPEELTELGRTDDIPW